MPLYLHPTLPHAAMLKPYTGYGWNLPGPGLGYGAETAVAAVRLIYSGLFDRFPGLQLILGHLGEALYFWLYRLDFEFTRPWVKRQEQARLQRRPSEYLRSNFHVTISGNFLTSAFMATLAEAGADRLLFASDYPFEGMDAAVAFMEQLPIGPADRAKIYGGNAARLLGL